MITWQESNIERPKSLVQIAADAIRRGIILRELVLGQPLTEAGLAKTLGISKTPVREGLSLLRSEGLVVAEPHRGYRVFNMTQEELVDFCELRFALESQALRYAVQRQPLKLAQQLQQILTEMEANFSPKNREKYFELDTNFHKSFFALLKVDSCFNIMRISMLLLRLCATIFLGPIKQREMLMKITKRLRNA